MEIRNIAIIAHVDHGKTTLTDALLSQNGMNKENVSMDSNALELERGITIYAKNTSLYYKGTKINIVDTPGHADFGSEVERVLRAIDTVLLLVDAEDGPMPQTRFVLKKSLELGMKPIVVLNKIDKPNADPKRVHDEILELFFELEASDEQINFTTLYASGRDGYAKYSLADENKDLSPLLDTILKEIPAKNEEAGSATLQVFNLDYDNYLGRLGICRVYGGTLKMGEKVIVKHPAKSDYTAGITKLCTFEGHARKEVNSVSNGDIIMLAGLPDIYIGDTVTTDATKEALPAIKVDEPTIALNFLVNDSPFAGKEGTYVTSRQIRERLERECETNVGLKVDFSRSDYMTVYGRGELHIAILIENMRREGFELAISQPEVVLHEDNGIKSEPFEEVIADVPTSISSAVIEKLGKRKGIMMNMREHEGRTRLIYEIPTRGLLGYREQFVVDTRGEGVLSSRFVGYRPFAGDIEKHEFGSMISMESGKAAAFSLDNLQKRGVLYIEHGNEIYEGQVVGNVSKGEDLYVNPTKGKQLTNMRASGSDEKIYLTPAYKLTVERAMEIMQGDEYVEITPESVRLRKKYLTKAARDKAGRTTHKAGE